MHLNTDLYKFLLEVKNLLISTPKDTPASQGIMSFFSGLGEISNKLLFTGGMKYLILILLEMIIFHFAVKTYEILSGEKRILKLKDFINAEIRMIKVAIRAWFYELVLSFLVVLILGLFGLDFIENIIVFFIQCYFLGVVFIDNYNEQFNIKIKASFKIAYQHFGATFIFGLLAYVLILLPLIGVILAPIICAVGATCYLYYSKEKTEVELV